MDDLGKEVVKMEYKLVLFALTLLGIPAGIWAYFLEVNQKFDLIKGIILLCIGSFTGIVLGLRYLVRLLTEIKEFMNKYYPKEKK